MLGQAVPLPSRSRDLHLTVWTAMHGWNGSVRPREAVGKSLMRPDINRPGTGLCGVVSRAPTGSGRNYTIRFAGVDPQNQRVVRGGDKSRCAS